MPARTPPAALQGTALGFVKRRFSVTPNSICLGAKRFLAAHIMYINIYVCTYIYIIFAIVYILMPYVNKYCIFTWTFNMPKIMAHNESIGSRQQIVLGLFCLNSLLWDIGPLFCAFWRSMQVHNIYIYIYIHMYVKIYTYVCIYIYICYIHMYIYTHVYIYIHIYTCIYIHRIYIHIHTYVCIRVHMYKVYTES